MIIIWTYIHFWPLGYNDYDEKKNSITFLIFLSATPTTRYLLEIDEQ